MVITGGSRGLGLAMARNLAKRGAKLALCARNPEELERARNELAEHAQVFAAVCDVRSDTAVSGFITDAAAALGPIDVLITNAATIQVGPLASHDRADFENAMDETLWGAYRATMAVLPSMRERKQGRIVHIASFGGKVAVPHVAPYCTAKFALEGFSTGLRSELVGEGIYVTTVSPGLMRTGSHLAAEFKGNQPLEFLGFSLGLALRVGSLEADVAADRIVEAMRDGDAELVLGWPAVLLSTLHGLAPNVMGEMLGLVGRLLPSEPGARVAKRGSEVRKEAPGQAIIDTLDGVAERYNEL